MRLHSCASSPEGPAAPDIFKAAERIAEATSDSNITGVAPGALHPQCIRGRLAELGGAFVAGPL